jgi:hypothetical protein
MKRFLVILLFVMGAVALSAQSAGLALVNGEPLVLYYSLDPALTVAANRTGTEDVFQSLDRVSFGSLPANGTLRLDGLAPGAHTVLGFWSSDNVVSYGVFSLEVTLAAGQLKSFTLKQSSVTAAKDTRTTARIKDTLAATPIVIDNAYTDWDPYPAIALFPGAFAPPQFSLQSKEGARSFPLKNALSWGKGGTQLLTVKALWRNEGLYFYTAAATPLAPGLSVFLYLFDDRQSSDLNQYTLELPILDDSGAGQVLLWQRGVTEPVPVGTFRDGSFFLEAFIDFSRLPAALRDNLFAKYSFDLKTSYYDSSRGVHEEYYFTSIDCGEIYRQP